MARPCHDLDLAHARGKITTPVRDDPTSAARDGTPPSARLVSASDKLHNARAILADYRELGPDLWERFNGGREGTLWYYRALVGAFRKSPPPGDGKRLVDELDRVVAELERMAAPVHGT
ncbi:MAG: hypothetical protein ACLP1X_13620 [Polyangiaceae bacterium]